ncbi:Myelin proteolipid, partial [Fasciolopsis buskii]
LQYLRIAAVVNGAVTIVLAFIIVIFATLVTSATRGRIYRGDRCIMGGRLSAAMFMCSTYAAIVLWLVFLAFLVIPTMCWIMFNSICTMELAHVWHGPGARRPGPDGRVAPSLEELRLRNELTPVDDTYTARLAYYYPELVRSMGYLPAPNGPGLVAPPGEPRPPLSEFPPPPSPFGAPGSRYVNRLYYSDFNYVFNLTNYGIYIKPWLFDERLNYREAITSLEEFAGFCDEVAIVGPLFACSLAGAIFVLLGLTLFIGSLSGFYTRLKLTKELTDFKQSIALRSPKNHDHAAYF